MVECLNRSLLQMLKAFVEQKVWEKFLPLVLNAYRIAPHSSTGISPFTLMFGREPKPGVMETSEKVFEPGLYQAFLQSTFAQLHDFVETSLTAAAESQERYYNSGAKERSFQSGDLVWLSEPTAKKLDPHWKGGWRVTEMKSPVTVEITNDQQTRLVHINRLRRRIQLSWQSVVQQNSTTEWTAPQIDHKSSIESPGEAPHRYPQGNRHPPDWLTF